MDHELHPVSRLTTQLGYDMGVGIHRQSDLRVTENVHDYTWRHTLCEQQCCAGMTQVMESTLLQPGALQQPMKLFADRRAI